MAVLDDAICPSLSKPQARHIAALIELCGSDAASAFFKQVYNERKNTPMYDTLYAEISKIDSFKDIANAMLQYSKVKKQLTRSELGLKGSSEDAG